MKQNSSRVELLNSKSSKAAILQFTTATDIAVVTAIMAIMIESIKELELSGSVPF